MKKVISLFKYQDGDKDYKHSLIQTTIILCWLCLLFCMIFKLFIPEYFIIQINNSNIINLCNVIGRNVIFKILFVFIFNCILTIPYFLAIYKKKWFKNKFQTISILVLISLNSIFKILCCGIISCVFDLVIFIVYPLAYLFYENKGMIISKKEKLLLYFRPLIYYISLQIYIALSFFIRSINVKLIVMDNILINLIFSLDVFIMVFLLYLYQIKRSE